MAKFIMVACDLHDKTMLLKVSTGRGAAETVSVRNTPAGRQRLIAELQARRKPPAGRRSSWPTRPRAKASDGTTN